VRDLREDIQWLVTLAVFLVGTFAVTTTAAGPGQPGFKKLKGEICAASAKTINGAGGFKSIRTCITEDGNVKSYGIGNTRFLDEGYRICHFDGLFWVSPGADTGPGPGSNFDAPSIVSQPNGDGTLPVTIERTTSDSSFVLTQTFDQGVGEVLSR
jgi:hypothetical protein